MEMLRLDVAGPGERDIGQGVDGLRVWDLFHSRQCAGIQTKSC